MIYVAFNAFTGETFNGAYMMLLKKERDVRGGDFYFF